MNDQDQTDGGPNQKFLVCQGWVRPGVKLTDSCMTDMNYGNLSVSMFHREVEGSSGAYNIGRSLNSQWTLDWVRNEEVGGGQIFSSH